MDIKYLLCDSNTPFAAKENQAVAIHPNEPYNMEWSRLPSFKDNNSHDMWTASLSSPKSTCSSISTCSSPSSCDSDIESPASSRSSSFSYSSSPPKEIQSHYQQQQNQNRRRTASDASVTRHRMFIYSHPHRRPRSESAGNNAVQTRTPWTPFEDQLLQQGYDQGLSWAMISSTYLPHRSRGCCWGRFKTLQNKNMVDPNHSHMRHFRRPWKAIDFSSNNKE
jgi:hypothetical protein